jgi:hypothetical protein
MPWAYLRQTRVTVVLRSDAIIQGALVVDASDKKRGTVTTRIFKAHTLQDKTRGGGYPWAHPGLVVAGHPSGHHAGQLRV